MKREILVCDFCGDEGDVIRYMVATKTQVDPPSGKTEEWFEEVDICPKCSVPLVRDHLKSMSYADANSLIQRARRVVASGDH